MKPPINKLPGMEYAPISTLLHAARFATFKHREQVRKYTREPYVYHCFSVAKILADNDCGEPCMTVAILHDTLEDTNTTFQELEENFGSVIAQIVFELTDASLHMGNRATRKEINAERMKNASWYAKTVKYADLIDNIASITEHDQKFGKVFMQEVAATYATLSGGDERLYQKLGAAIMEGKERLNSQGC